METYDKHCKQMWKLSPLRQDTEILAYSESLSGQWLDPHMELRSGVQWTGKILKWDPCFILITQLTHKFTFISCKQFVDKN